MNEAALSWLFLQQGRQWNTDNESDHGVLGLGGEWYRKKMSFQSLKQWQSRFYCLNKISALFVLADNIAFFKQESFCSISDLQNLYEGHGPRLHSSGWKSILSVKYNAGSRGQWQEEERNNCSLLAYRKLWVASSALSWGAGCCHVLWSYTCATWQC